MDERLARFPKERPPLPDAHRRIYETEYKTNRGEGPSLVARAVMRLESWMHRQMASHGDRLLELGAGTLNHVAHEADWARYDVVEPFEALWSEAPARDAIDDIFADIRDVPEDRAYDRVLSVAVLEHLCDLPSVVARAALHLAPGGRFQAGIPSEGGLLWWLSWRFGTGTAYRLRTGLPYAPLMHHEHVNDAAEIEHVVRHFFGRVERRRFPGPWLHASFYTYLDASEPDEARCRAWLEREHTGGQPSGDHPAAR